jgi:hypothetical protein
MFWTSVGETRKYTQFLLQNILEDLCEDHITGGRILPGGVGRTASWRYGLHLTADRTQWQAFVTAFVV